MQDDHSLPPTSRSLPIALMRAREKVMAPIRDMLAESGLTEQQWRILRVLAEYGPLDASTLADRASLLLPSQTRIVQSMSARGLVTRKPDPEDRRRQTVSITPAGQSFIDENMAEAIQIAEHFRRALGEERFDLLLDLLLEVDEKI